MRQIQPEGNYFNKYVSKNPIVKMMMFGFFRKLKYLLAKAEYSTVYEVGCGEGYITRYISQLSDNVAISAYDIKEIH
ncbi:MAG: hypothetical protein LBH05_07675 [Deferribacteraceae bacterium]|jgi:protein-L-isoaspartate O-methyltransferase|nr:hypothetical protein [Deferribacteraceae bacterium]